MLLAVAVSLLLQPSFVDLTRNSSIIFTGRLEKTGASTPSVPATNDTAVVRVDDVLSQPRQIVSLKGHEVTVRFRNGQPPPAGRPMLFFTTLYTAGETVGLDAVGVLAVPAGQAAEELAKARQTILDEDTAARLARSEFAVAGVVRSIKVLTVPDERRVSEHDPEWAEAQLAVRGVIKGQPANRELVTVYFASSRSALYAHWAKLREGDSVVVIAQREDPRLKIAFDRSPIRPPGPFVVDRNDVQPAERFERVRGLTR